MSHVKKQICEMTGAEQSRLIREKQISPVEVIEEVFNRIHNLNPILKAFCVLDEENARTAAKDAEEDIMSGKEIKPLHGVPVAIKDLIMTKGIRTTFGSKLYENFIPAEDDICIDRLKNAGAIIIGKTNVPEFGYKGVTDNKVFGTTRNPWNTNLTPGGSSGGSGVAVATGMSALSIGNDAAGSIRTPSSFCGIYGIKPSFGRVPLYPSCRNPRYPGASSHESLECNGPMTRTVEDSALILSIITGHHHMDRHSLPNDNTNYLEIIKNTNISGLKIAWSPNLGYAQVDPVVKEITENAVKVFEQLGCHIEVANPELTNPIEALYGITAHDTDLKGLRELAEKNADIMGQTILKFIQKDWTAEELTNAMLVRQEVNIKMRKFMEKYDLLLTPTVATPPYELDSPRIQPILTCPMNMTGQPAASVPGGWTRDGLPIGLQIIGRHLDDVMVLRASAAFEEANPWAHSWPGIL